jgi:integrase
VRHGKLRQSLIAEVGSLPENNVRMRILTLDEFQSLYENCPAYLKPVVEMAFFMGMRRSEIIKLTWGEVDLKAGFVRSKEPRTKTKVARAVPIHPRVKAALDGLPRGIHTDPVFLLDEKPFDEFRRSFKSACRAAGIAGFNFHDLRHCSLNNLRLSGNDYFRIMAVSGHKTMSCFKRYNLVTEEELSQIKWPDSEGARGAMDTYMDTIKEGAVSQCSQPLEFIGSGDRIRTCDLRVMRRIRDPANSDTYNHSSGLNLMNLTISQQIVTYQCTPGAPLIT